MSYTVRTRRRHSTTCETPCSARQTELGRTLRRLRSSYPTPTPPTDWRRSTRPTWLVVPASTSSRSPSAAGSTRPSYKRSLASQSTKTRSSSAVDSVRCLAFDNRSRTWLVGVCISLSGQCEDRWNSNNVLADTSYTDSTTSSQVLSLLENCPRLKSISRKWIRRPTVPTV